MRFAAFVGCSALGLLWLPLSCSSAETPERSLGAPAASESDPPPSTVPERDGPAAPVLDVTEAAPPDIAPSAPEPSNSQTGSPGGVECISDSDCSLDLERWALPLGNLELVAANCGFLNALTQPVCECKLLRTPLPGAVGGPAEPYVFSAWPGNRPGGCSEYDRTSACTYCEREFPGCSIDEVGSCDAVCADFTQRQRLESARSFSVRERLARCNAQNRCERVYELEGRCYIGAPGRPQARSYDCSLSDAELLAQSELAILPSCEARRVVSCSDSNDCPAGLACKEGVCGPCVQECTILDSGQTCRGGGACASGETCAGDTCVPDANLTCSSFIDCGVNQQCVISGIDWTAGRGNADTRTFCR